MPNTPFGFAVVEYAFDQRCPPHLLYPFLFIPEHLLLLLWKVLQKHFLMLYLCLSLKIWALVRKGLIRLWYLGCRSLLNIRRCGRLLFGGRWWGLRGRGRIRAELAWSLLDSLNSRLLWVLRRRWHSARLVARAVWGFRYNCYLAPYLSSDHFLAHLQTLSWIA